MEYYAIIKNDDRFGTHKKRWTVLSTEIFQKSIYIFSIFKSKKNKGNGVYINALKCVEGIKPKMSMVFSGPWDYELIG